MSATTLADRVAATVLAAYARLPKTGKPAARPANNKHEWTVLAGIVAVFSQQEQQPQQEPVVLECVALGTGLKCLNPSQMPADGSCLHDSHAEAICRRSFMHFLYACLDAELLGLQQPLPNRPGILVPLNATSKEANDGDDAPPRLLFRVADNVAFHFYVSQSPCGDASMSALTMQQTAAERIAHNQARKRKFDNGDDDDGIMASTCTIGATPTVATTTSSTSTTSTTTVLRGRHDYSALGRLRTKPARTDAETTRSMSCSDKLARWVVLGLQGALLSRYIPRPIRLQTLVVGPERFDEASVRRAVVERARDAVRRGRRRRRSSSNDGVAGAVVLQEEEEEEEEEVAGMRVETTGVQFEFAAGALRSTTTTTTTTTTTADSGVKKKPKLGNADADAAAVDCTTADDDGDGDGDGGSIVLIPANAALAWDASRGARGPAEVTVAGRKQGAAKRSSICRASLYARFLALESTPTPTTTYHAAKLASTRYQAARTAMLADPNFAGWVFGGQELQQFFTC
ncbi:hypothetical protein HDU86_002628 [Geranomyces michiganensis]|nr:hypothetical protein HDU86_002628 [Geranomyces michiganensis]